MTTSVIHRSNPHTAIRTDHVGPVIIACDGTSTDDTILIASRKAAVALGAPIEVVGVCAPTTDLAGAMEIAPSPPDLDETRRKAMLGDVQRFVSTTPAGDKHWPIDVRMGAPARTIASEAARRDASLLVMGIGRHNPLDRLFGAEVTLATVRESRVPVLAVGACFTGPSHVVVGLDFSECSIRAAELSVELLQGHGRISLVHVRPRFEQPSPEWQAWDAEYGRTLPPLFDDVRRRLDIPPKVSVETVTLRGEPATTLLAYAQQVSADLIAVGTQRHTFIERMMVGSVATRVLRTARCGVLAVPAAAVSRTRED